MQPQKSFGTFIAERYGPKWVYAARRSPRIARQYPDSTVITPKQQRQLQVDYAAAWGREYDPQFWLMLCALRTVIGQIEFCRFTPEAREEVQYAIEQATNGKRC